MGIIIWIVVGIALGYVANMLFNRDNALGNIIGGVFGSALAGFVATLFSVGSFSAFHLLNLIIAAAGACLVLVAGGKFLKRRV